MTIIPPRSHTKFDVGIVSCPGWSNTIRGLAFSPSASQKALPNALAPSSQPFQSGESHAAGTPPRIVEVPLPRVHGDRIADLYTGDVGTNGVDDPARVGAHDVEVGRLVPSSLRLRDVDRDPARGPHVVEVDAGGHDGDQHVA